MKRFLICISIFLVGILHTNAQSNYPKLAEFVTDQASVMTLSERASLQEKLIAYEEEKTHQIVVLTIESLEGNTIENYALQVFNTNGIGQEQADNGILVLFSKVDREVRIEVGNGFEPIITDAFASRVIRNTMIPEFKEENYFKGINSGADEIIKLINDPQYRDEFALAIEEEGQMPLWGKILFGTFMTAFLGFFVFSGARVFFPTYKTLIDIYKGFITGKISLLTFPFLLIMTIFGLLIGLVFILVPFLFATVFVQEIYYNGAFSVAPDIIFENPNLVMYLVITAVALFVGIPLVIALFSKKPYQVLKLSLVKNDKHYMSQNISSSGSSWSSGGSSSGGSSSSFSGGGGSSRGGGASGSW